MTERHPRPNTDNGKSQKTFSEVVKKQPIPTGRQTIPRLQQNGFRGDRGISDDRPTLMRQPRQNHENNVRRRNGTTFIGTKVRAPFLELSRYDKDRGENTDRRNRETLDPRRKQQNSPIILDEETSPKEIL